MTYAAGSTDNKTQRVKVIVAKDSMSASIVVKAPGKDEHEITVDEIINEIQMAEISYGIDEEEIKKLVSEQRYNQPTRIASGEMPKRGASASFEYHFDTEMHHHPQEDDDGRIDYKNMNFIQNTEKDALLVTKTPPQPGVPGKNIFGKSIKGPDGKDIPFKNGVNTYVSEDGLKLFAAESGAIVYVNGKVHVDNLMIIRGNVDFNVGNIDCKGSVKVTGDVKTGFEIKIDGNLEVLGNVEDCMVEAQGNILVKGGFFGKRQGYLKAGGDVTVKYAENQKIFSGGDVYVGGEVINCEITAKGNVYVSGKHGKIIGGKIRAFKEIHAAVLGTDSGTITELTVAFRPELYARLEEIESELSRLAEDKDRVKEALINLHRLDVDGKLNRQQAEALKKLEDFKKNLPQNLETLNAEKIRIEDEIFKIEGAMVVAEGIAYPGVKVYFGPVYRELNEDKESCVFTSQDGKIFISDYKEYKKNA